VAAVTAYARRLPTAPILVGHDAGAIIALAAAAQGPAAAVALLAPLVPGSAAGRGLATRWGGLMALLRGGPVPPPGGRVTTLVMGDLPSAVRAVVEAQLGPDDAATILDIVRGRVDPPPAGRLPALLLTGDHDPLLAPPDAAVFAGAIGAEHQILPDTGHWLLAGPRWLRTVDVLHRWLVQRLGESILELYPEAMAERDADDDEP
jgi:pimeloyl-ACP methyl ester carboxylesterase